MRIDWDEYFICVAKLTALRSTCNSRPTGAVIVKNKRIISTGYNGSLPGKEQCIDKGETYCKRRNTGKDDSGENKYQECPSIHAEQNAINQIAFLGGISLEGAIIYCTLFPCIHCLKNIASVGIKEIVYEMDYKSDHIERDSFWLEEARQNFKIKQVTLSAINEAKVMFNFNTMTSFRRL